MILKSLLSRGYLVFCWCSWVSNKARTIIRRNYIIKFVILFFIFHKSSQNKVLNNHQLIIILAPESREKSRTELGAKSQMFARWLLSFYRINISFHSNNSLKHSQTRFMIMFKHDCQRYRKHTRSKQKLFAAYRFCVISGDVSGVDRDTFLKPMWVLNAWFDSYRI